MTAEARALDWLREYHKTHPPWTPGLVNKAAEAAEVLRIYAYGSDWNGSTEGGFYSQASVTIEWRAVDGRVQDLTVDGEDFPSLWNWMVT